MMANYCISLRLQLACRDWKAYRVQRTSINKEYFEHSHDAPAIALPITKFQSCRKLMQHQFSNQKFLPQICFNSSGAFMQRPITDGFCMQRHPPVTLDWPTPTSRSTTVAPRLPIEFCRIHLRVVMRRLHWCICDIIRRPNRADSISDRTIFLQNQLIKKTVEDPFLCLSWFYPYLSSAAWNFTELFNRRFPCYLVCAS